jgi:hypothetical protein
MEEVNVEDLLVENKLIMGFIDEFLGYTAVEMNDDQLILSLKLVKQYAKTLQIEEK